MISREAERPTDNHYYSTVTFDEQFFGLQRNWLNKTTTMLIIALVRRIASVDQYFLIFNSKC